MSIESRNDGFYFRHAGHEGGPFPDYFAANKAENEYKSGAENLGWRKRVLLRQARETPPAWHRKGVANLADDLVSEVADPLTGELTDTATAVAKGLHAAAIEKAPGEWEWHRRDGGGHWSKAPPLGRAPDALERAWEAKWHPDKAAERKRKRTTTATKTRTIHGAETRQRVLDAAAADTGPTYGRIKRIADRAGVSADYAGRILSGKR